MDSDYYSQSQNTESQVSRSCTAQAGTIVKILMKNFMCHDHYEVKLNPRINFICGKNGSGKSAIQTAIAVGLGGKALATNRGSSMKELIKNDKNSCTIVIEMINQGPLAYRPMEYGSQIHVERSFSHSSQGYKIKNAQGKVVSTEKKELDKIVAQFNIQTDNPVCILHQDVARNFLNSSDPKNKFKFYMKASRFDVIAKLYTESSIRVLTIRETINSKFEVVKEAFSDVIEMRKKLKTMQEGREKQKHRENLENELVWARIHESNLQLQDLEKKKESEVRAKKKAENLLKEEEEINMKEKLRGLEQRIVEMDEIVKDAREKLSPARDELSRKKEKLLCHGRALEEAQQNIKSTDRKYKNCKTEMENLTKNAPEKKLQQEKMKKELAKNEATLESIKAAECSFERDKVQLRDTIDNMNANLQSARSHLNELQRQKSKREDQVKQITKNASSLMIYGEVMVKVVDEINKAVAQRKFEKKPVGPIGMHIKVRESQWAGAVENYLGKGNLSSFCVDNARDSTVLSSILKNVCRRYRASQPAIICSKFLTQVHNIGSSETGTREFISLARALDIDHPVVANCLIDQQEVETVLLIPTNNDAYQLLDETHKVPRNCKKAFTLTGDQFFPAPNYKSYSSNRPVTHATLLQTNQEEVLIQLKNEINKLVQDIRAAEAEVTAAQQDLNGTMETLKKNEAELRNLQRQRYGIEQKVADLRSSEELEAPEANLTYFIDEERELKSQLEKETKRIQDLKRELSEVQAAHEEAKSVFKELHKTVTESDQEKAPIQGEIQRLKSSIHQATSKAELVRQKIREHDDKLGQIDTEITVLSEQVNQNTENASQICAPVNTQRRTEEINRELKGVELYLKRLEEENGGSLEELQRNLAERQETFNTVNGDLEHLLNLIKKTQKALKMRKSKENILHSILANSAKHNFQSFLNERNFDGKLEFDLEAGTLEIKVKTPHKEVDRSAKRLDTSSLSGGEKSFSTVCFIMALWQEMELPFHFLDEFDVFMDGMNRRIVMDLLIGYAQGIRQQFVFLTPLDMSSVSISSNITVHRLEAPRQ